ncbi:MAG TPA: bifunctional diaminohydroxyphosphoribosylaminopyrimidine deaminase/5-amino-6-(5-phosphoribosylamino)uracil reductase RibD [Chitinophagaceae bacterium]|nr:bifunctional diaminohydroxyphosphoribosylaminopyrimidine deaminase/5-amino-6-(5-phosphoribosylamino)uracil reductase RibD [Chitinophagaceae bacterium]
MPQTPDQLYMQRCLQLAATAGGWVAPNPMVGAVLVHESRIIGEGYHQLYGQAHAEVNCIRSVKEEDRHLISQSTLYVSLEPCAHKGKTPPCADLIIQHQIPHVVLACRDPFTEVNGRGIEKLKQAGVEVREGLMEQEARWLNRRFFTFHEHKKPYVLLKWAQTANGMIGNADGSRLLISNKAVNRLVHRWRSEEAAILVGTNTAQLDNPSLINQYWSGPSPVRVVLDRSLRLPPQLKIFDGKVRTVVLNKKKQSARGMITYHKIEEKQSLPWEIMQALYDLQLQSVLIEGGAQLMQLFIDAGLWNEARIITSPHISNNPGISAPRIKGARLYKNYQILGDRIEEYHRL